MTSERRPILCVDFDGVVHSYSSGWKGATVIPDPPVAGAFEWLLSAHDAGWDVQIYSSRSKEENALPAMRDWFEHEAFRESRSVQYVERLMSILSFPTQKPAANMTIDDRALCFKGDWSKIDPVALLSFKPWNKR